MLSCGHRSTCLWNGGIGTYVKSASETDLEVGDRANDSVRVDASDLRCKVIAEGGNLGVTQKRPDRVRQATAAGSTPTPSTTPQASTARTTRSTSRSCSSSWLRNGDLTRKQRNQLLESMADEVCTNVLDNNYSQNESLSAAQAQAGGMVQVHARVMGWLEREALLDRAVEALPTDAEMLERQESGSGLTRPELAVLLAYTKNLLTSDLSRSELPDDPWLEDRLFEYFPGVLRSDFAELIETHPLRRELLSTLVSNDVVNNGGISMTHRLMSETSASTSDIARAHVAAWSIYGLQDLQDQVRSLVHDLPAATQIRIDQEIKRLGERAARWLLRNETQPVAIADVVAAYREPVQILNAIVSADVDCADLVGAGVPGPLAARIETLGAAYGFLDLSHVATRTGAPLEQVASIYGALDTALDLTWLRDRITMLPRNDHWEALARSGFVMTSSESMPSSTATVVARAQRSDDGEATDLVGAWISRNDVAVERCRRTFDGIRNDAEHDLARVSVAVQAMSQLSRTV